MNKLDKKEKGALNEATKLTPKLIYELIRRDGEEELRRPATSLIWSGIAAGIMISFSVVGEAIFRTYLPDAPHRYLVENLGYTFGFLFVILGRLQLFTENTITTVLPVMLAPNRSNMMRMARLWGIVLAANVVGAFAIAAFFAAGGLPVALHPAVTELSHHATGMGAADSFLRGIPAGILIAALVWALPQAKGTDVFVIIAFTWLIAAGDFTHVVAGSVEMAWLVVHGALGFGPAVGGFFLPVLAGNVVGGTAIFAFMAWGQVKEEV